MKRFTPDFLGETQFGSALLRLALSVALCFAFLSQARGDHRGAGTNRFLFIVEASASAKKIDEPMREAVFDLIYSGVRGNMTNGDTFGVWLVSATNDTSMGVETWKSKFAVQSAAKIALRLKDQGFKGKTSAFSSAISDAARVAESVGDLTVIATFGGDEAIRGTPFDDAINARVQELLPEMRRVKAVFNLVMAAQDGKFVAWKLNSPEFLIEMPTVPPRPKKEPAAVASAAASAPQTNTAPLPAKVAEAKPKPAAPIFITRETVDRDKQMMRALASTDSTSSIAAAKTNSASANTNTVASPVTVKALESNAPIAVTAPAIAPVAPLANAAVAHTNVPELAPKAVASIPESEKVAATTNTAWVQKAVPPLVPEANVLSGKLIWAFGGAAAVVLFLVIYGFVRRARELEPSLISQVAAMERIQR